MGNIPKELIGEIILELDEIWKEGEPFSTLREIKAQSTQYYWGEVWAIEGEKWERIITRIGKAYAEGQVKLPGEVGRNIVESMSVVDGDSEGLIRAIVVGTVWGNKQILPGDILIALRPEEEK